MTIKEKIIHGFMLAVLFSVINWLIIDGLIINVSIIEYLFIEITFVLSIKLFKFTKLKLKLD
jgi:hypothetical protein